MDNADLLFGAKTEKQDTTSDMVPLYSIGQLRVENDFLKKALDKRAPSKEDKK